MEDRENKTNSRRHTVEDREERRLEDTEETRHTAQDTDHKLLSLGQHAELLEGEVADQLHGPVHLGICSTSTSTSAYTHTQYLSLAQHGIFHWHNTGLIKNGHMTA